MENPILNQQNNKIFIQGITNKGKKFRPSDWAERLCCSVSCFTPEGQGIKNNICGIFSPYAVPVFIGDTQFVMVDKKLMDFELNAFNFLMDFAKDNDLPILEACEIKENP